MLDVSRTDIVSNSFMDFPTSERFIKLPIDSYLDLLGITPNSSQTALINAVNNPKYRLVCAAISRRQGKTYIANVIGQLVSLVPGSNILIMSPNYSLSQISFDLQRGLIKHFDLEVTKDNAKDKVIELSNGSTIRMGSVNQVDSSVGRSYDLIIFDEAALADGKDAFNVALRPTLDKINSKAVFISTPRGRNNWFADFYHRGFSEEFSDWASIRATYHENPRFSDDDIKEAKKAAEENGIVFLDEIDKVSARSDRVGGDVSREGVQRDLLPLIEGTTVSTKHGPIKTDHILFIASGAFQLAKPSDLLPELQGRLPIRVELNALKEEDFIRILKEPDNSLIKQYKELLKTEDVNLEFTDDGIESLAKISAEVNSSVENIGARRLHTIIEKVLDDISFNATDRSGETIVINKKYVQDNLGNLVKDTDLSKFIL